jgi:hypothetical protein
MMSVMLRAPPICAPPAQPVTSTMSLRIFFARVFSSLIFCSVIAIEMLGFTPSVAPPGVVSAGKAQSCLPYQLLSRLLHGLERIIDDVQGPLNVFVGVRRRNKPVVVRGKISPAPSAFAAPLLVQHETFIIRYP